MAQRTEKDETELKIPETIALCSDCGLAGNSSPNNTCRKCSNDSSSSTPAPSSSFTTERISASDGKSSEIIRRSRSPHLRGRFRSLSDASRISRLNQKESSGRELNRCSGCRKRVGLTGIRCRCGDLFCFEHRYSDRHDCSYDYKAVGREAIARENPVVKAAKIIKV